MLERAISPVNYIIMHKVKNEILIHYKDKKQTIGIMVI